MVVIGVEVNHTGYILAPRLELGVEKTEELSIWLGVVGVTRTDLSFGFTMTKGADKDSITEKSSVIRQVIFGLIIAGAKMQSGCVVGWSAVLPKAQADNSTHFEISDLDVTWLDKRLGKGAIGKRLRSPYWLVRQGMTEEASKSLKRLRGHDRDVSLELTEISKGLEEHSHASLIDQIKQLGAPQHFRPVLFLTSVFVVREFGGQYVIFAYTVYLFRKAGVALDAFLCTILVGLVRFVFTIIASAIADRLGRRPLFISSCLVCFVAFAVGGAFLLLELPGTSWVPLAAVLFYAASYSIGIGIMPWVLLGEVLPTPVRSLGSTICTFHFSLSQFIVSYLFPALVRWTSVGVVLVLFAVMHAILTVMLIFFLPETRGRSLSDLQNAFAPRSQQLESGMNGTRNSRDK
ncbi:facilitated trehalose transporter Tret1-like [Penaeus japonicus]|uniref:facilitated trehalose transporter Tret1-like n=1 Tax=Penaeus japonicus TaxID=27405 RepID=UPI001C715B6D|nr:facilitated trehalose transporter Tret1-like [Penaeus japonicus]